jgi:hypothetical protein
MSLRSPVEGAAPSAPVRHLAALPASRARRPPSSDGFRLANPAEPAGFASRATGSAYFFTKARTGSCRRQRSQAPAERPSSIKIAPYVAGSGTGVIWPVLP